MQNKPKNLLLKG